MMDVDQLLRGSTKPSRLKPSRLKPSRLRSRIAVASVLAAVTLLAGCGSDAEPSATEKTSTVPVYFVADKGKLVSVAQEVAGADKMSSQGRAIAAVEALIVETPEKDSGLKSHWGGDCGVGAGVDSLQKQSGLITIKMRGAAGVTCNRKGAEELQQRQQLAWTVVKNLGGDPSTPIQMYGPNGALMYNNLVADEKYLAG